jgi:hypothetical protein
MEPITTNSIYSGLIWFALLLCAVICAAFWIVEYDKEQLKREREYENLYSEIYNMIESYYIYDANYKYIKDWLIELGKLKFKNKEKTSVLTVKFFTKYASIARQKVMT